MRALLAVAMLVLLWCQLLAVSHAAAGYADQARMHESGQMEGMVGCQGLPDTDSDGGSDCPTEDATPEAGKLPVFFPLPPAAPFALVRAPDHGRNCLARHAMPQGRAPPRSRLCSWLI